MKSIELKAIEFPATMEQISLGIIAIQLDELIARFGPPHVEESDPYQVPGPTKYWGFETTGGQKVVIEFAKHLKMADIYAAPPDLDAAVQALGIPLDRIVWRAPKPPLG